MKSFHLQKYVEVGSSICLRKGPYWSSPFKVAKMITIWPQNRCISPGLAGNRDFVFVTTFSLFCLFFFLCSSFFTCVSRYLREKEKQYQFFFKLAHREMGNCAHIYLVAQFLQLIGLGRKLMKFSKANCLNRLSPNTTDLVVVSSPQAPLVASLAGWWPLGLRISPESVRIALVSSVSNRLASESNRLASESNRLASESNRPAVSTFEAGLIALEDGLNAAATTSSRRKAPWPRPK